MAKIKAQAVPDTHVLRVLMEEYLGMLRDAGGKVRKALSLDPNKEEFWDALSDLDPLLTLIESRSASLQEESLGLTDQLPED